MFPSASCARPSRNPPSTLATARSLPSIGPSIELPGFTTCIDPAVGTPGDRFRMVQGVAEIGERQKILLRGHLPVSVIRLGLTEFGRQHSIVQHLRTISECRENDIVTVGV